MSKLSQGSAILLLALATICATSLFAQEDAEEKKLKFHFQQVAKSVDPDPTKQDDAARLASLRKSIQGAISLLEKDDLRGFFEQYIDPFFLARFSGRSTVHEAFATNIEGNPNRAKGLKEQFLKTLTEAQTQQPWWLLEGRAASFIKPGSRSSRTAEYWIYFEGKWRISPET